MKRLLARVIGTVLIVVGGVLFVKGVADGSNNEEWSAVGCLVVGLGLWFV